MAWYPSKECGNLPNFLCAAAVRTDVWGSCCLCCQRPGSDRLLRYFLDSVVLYRRLPANGKYPTINVRIRIINGRSTEGLLTGDLPPVDQGQLVGSQDEVLTSQPLPYILPPLDLSPAAGSGAYMLNQQPDIYTPAIMGGAPVAGSQGYALSQQPFPYIPPPPDGSPVARPSSPPAPLLRPATLPLQTSGYFPPPP